MLLGVGMREMERLGNGLFFYSWKVYVVEDMPGLAGYGVGEIENRYLFWRRWWLGRKPEKSKVF